jgi:hypothetical protein
MLSWIVIVTTLHIIVGSFGILVYSKNYVAGAFSRSPLIVPETATTCTAEGLPEIDVIDAMAVRTSSTTVRFALKIARLFAPSKLIGARLVRLAPYSP